MAVVDVESLLESSGRGGDGGVVGGEDAQPFSPSSVSSSYLEEFDQGTKAWPVSPVNNSEEASRAQTLEFGGDRCLFGIPIHLLKGSITIDVVPLVPVGGLPVIRGYDWAPHDVSLQVSDYYMRKRLK